MASKRSLQSYKLAYFRRLNDIHIAAQVTVAALERSKDHLCVETVEGSRFQHFEVPSGNKPTARIRRQRLDMDVLVTRIMNRTEYENALVVAVSIIEDYILNLLRVMLLAHPDRLIRGTRVGEARTISLHEFVERDRDALLAELIDERIRKVLYDRPTEQLAYLGQVAEVRIEQEVIDRYLEVKATRDIIVHANGLANLVYVEKAGPLARAEAGFVLPMDRGYFDSAIAAMKGLIGDVHDQVSVRYAEDSDVLRRAAQHLA